jgi:TonB-linked SusC/RagA family outer membrane protein
VTGTVTDAQTQKPLPGAAVVEKGSQNGTMTDANGRYSLQLISETSILHFSYLGYASQEVSPSGTTLNIALAGKNSELVEVVVTALGIQQEERALGYAVESVSAKAITEVREANLVNVLAGRVAGVQTTNGSSGPGSSSRVVIRGETSLSGNNQPLFVVDGVPISNGTVSNRTENNESGFQEVDWGNGAAEISPDDIASITVLKGPGAAALYGSRGANGVILITTKDGSARQGIGVSFHSSFTVDRPLRLPQYQNQYGQGSGGLFAYENGFGAGTNDGGITSFGPRLQGQLIPQFNGPSADRAGNVVRGGDVLAREGAPIQPTPWEARPDNVKNFFQTGLTAIHTVALSGAGEEGSFRLAYTRLDNRGIIPNTDLQRNTLTLSGRQELSPKLSAQVFTSYLHSGSSHRPALGYGSENPMYHFAWMGRQVDTEALKNYWQVGQEGFRQFNFNYQWMDNPYLAVFENTNGFDKNRLLGNASVRYRLSDKLDIRVRSGMDYYHDLRASRRAFSTQRFKNGGYREDEVDFREVNTDMLLTYSTSLNERWEVTLSAGANRMDQETRYKGTQAGELSVPGIYNFENSRIPLVIQQESSRKRINSLYGIGRFAYRAGVFVDLTVRNDWASTLPINHNSFAYYSASVSGVLSEFVALPAAISFARVRASTASVGNDTDPLQLRNTFVFNENYGSFPLATSATTLLNLNLRPERLNALEAGGEVWFLQNRLGLDLALYQTDSKDQIVRLPASAASGYTQRLINGGKIRSRGVEAVLQAVPLRSNAPVQLKSRVTFSRNVSQVVELPAGIDQYVTGVARVYASTQNTVFYIASPQGGRVGDMYGTGFRKVNGQTLYNNRGLPVRDPDLRLLGNYNPDFMVGLGNELSFQNWSLHALLDWRQGGTIVSRTLAIGSTSGVLAHTAAGREEGIIGDGLMNSGTDSEPNYVKNTTRVSAEEYYNQYYNRANEESALYDASYLKLRQLSLTYALPTAWMSRMGLREARLGLIASNLFVLTENPHFDPELSAMQGRNFTYGVEDMSYPSSRSFGLSLKANF